MDVHMRVAGDRRVEQVSLATGPVLDRQRRPRRVMAEADPADRTGVGAICATGALARPAENLGDVPHRPVGRAIDGIPYRRGFGRRCCEFGGKADRLVRREHQVEAAELALVLRPGLAGVGAACLEQSRHFGIPRHLVRVDPDRPRDRTRHVGAPARPTVAAGVIGDEPPAFLELAAGLVESRWMDRLGFVLSEVAQDEAALGGGRDLAEIHHRRGASADSPWPFCSLLTTAWSRSPIARTSAWIRRAIVRRSRFWATRVAIRS